MKIEGIIFYIAGPVTGIPEGNRPLFDQAQVWLEQQGAIALNPTILPEGLASHQSYMNICLPMLREAQAILLLPGWHRSVGAKMEYDEARRLGMPMFHFTPIQDASIRPFSEGERHGH
jgi:hypothetical protein